MRLICRTFPKSIVRNAGLGYASQNEPTLSATPSVTSDAGKSGSVAESVQAGAPRARFSTGRERCMGRNRVSPQGLPPRKA